MIFAADWKPSFVSLGAPFVRPGSFSVLFKYALKPVFESFGLEGQAPPSVSAAIETQVLFALFVILVLIGLAFLG